MSSMIFFWVGGLFSMFESIKTSFLCNWKFRGLPVKIKQDLRHSLIVLWLPDVHSRCPFHSFHPSNVFSPPTPSLSAPSLCLDQIGWHKGRAAESLVPPILWQLNTTISSLFPIILDSAYDESPLCDSKLRLLCFCALTAASALFVLFFG